ncbi:MAG TPA: alanyl-tRNA editing protein [Gemmatimonadales bacterium]|nr:alanyl-tRNA editing protein [Gemmatimonadales bacterium]
MTQRLYYTDAYLTTFPADVLDRAEDGTVVYLDRTAFYPTSGGQPHDTGRLGSSRVVDVVDEGDRIAHRVDAPVSAGPLEGVIDWTRRFDHMQQHTGQHLLSAVLADLTGHATVSVHFGRDLSTLDLDTPELPKAQVVEAELRANRIVTENRPVEVSFEEAASAEGLRKASEREGTLRIVTIRDLDRSACGGTHVRATGEIGPILIRRLERVRKTVRLEFLCGERAVRRARADAELLADLAVTQSAAPEELPALFAAQRQELSAAAAARRDLETALAGYRARELYQTSAQGAGSARVVMVQEEAGPPDRLRALAQAVAGLPQGVFLGATRTPAGVILASAEDSGVDVGRLVKEVLGRMGGRGGGNARLAQGSLPSAEALEGAVAQLRATLTGKD